MTVSAQTPLNRSTGNGVTTVFPYTFKVLAAADMEVSVDGVVKTLTTDYTLSGVGTDSGNVTFLVAPANGTTVVRRRNMAYTRSVDYQDQGELATDVLDDDQDAPILMIQQLDEGLGRAFTLPLEVSGVSLELPTPEAGTYLGWNALGTALVNYAGQASVAVSTFMATVVAAADAAAARVLLGATTIGSAVFSAADTTAARTAIGALQNSVQDFRLTLTSGLPVTTADVTGATTIYATPKTGNYIDLYDGTNWNRRASAEFSLALGTLTSGKPYDVFCYDNAGVPTLEFLVWTNDTTRATALVRQDGVLVKSGAVTRRYMGTFYTTATTTTEDSVANRYLWNYYHRAKRAMTRTDSNATWPYQTATWRQADNTTANQLNFLLGVAEDAVSANLTVSAASSSTNNGYSGIGLDSTTPTSERAVTTFGTGTATNSVAYDVLPSAGRHFLAWCEFGAGAGTLLWNGTTGEFRSGMFGSVMA